MNSSQIKKLNIKKHYKNALENDIVFQKQSNNTGEHADYFEIGEAISNKTHKMKHIGETIRVKRETSEHQQPSVKLKSKG